MRDRAWRRYMKDKKSLRRLKNIINRSYSYYYYTDINHTNYPRLEFILNVKSLIGTYDDKKSRELSTTTSDSKFKEKYSPNKSNDYGRPSKIPKKSRVFDKRDFLKLLKEYHELGETNT